MNKQIFAIDLIRDLPIDKWVKTLNSLLLNGKPEIQKEIPVSYTHLTLPTNREV